MNDDNKIVARVVSNKAEIDSSISLLLQEMLVHQDMVVGFDMEYCFEHCYGEASAPFYSKKKIALLTLCTQSICVLIGLPKYSYEQTLEKLCIFLANKDIVFVCVHKKEDLLKVGNGLQITNAVELSELAVRVLGHPHLGAYGARKLASYLGVLQIEPRSSSLAWTDWGECNRLTADQIKCATADAYASYKIGKNLLEI